MSRKSYTSEGKRIGKHPGKGPYTNRYDLVKMMYLKQ